MFVLLVDKRELRAPVGGGVVDSLAGPRKMWVIFCLGLNVDVAGVIVGEGHLKAWRESTVVVAVGLGVEKWNEHWRSVARNGDG